MAIVIVAVGSSAGQGTGVAFPPGYTGSEICGTCHEDLAKAFEQNPHHAIDTQKRRGWEGRVCESCHGPAQKHTESASADDIRNPAKLAPAVTDKICLTCHLGQPEHAGRLRSSHARDQVPCTTCHKIHANGPFGLVPRTIAAINEQCRTCHISAAAQFQRPYHHPVPEGGMSCVDCHNPHGSIRVAMTRSFAGNDAGCFRCHGDKRGPFTFSHAPMLFEGCGACHEPHGSANPRMLTRPVVQQVCLECHANLPSAVSAGGIAGVVPPSFHDLRSPRFQNCTVCHQKIHGSYVDRNLLR